MTAEFAFSNKHERLAVGRWRRYLYPILLLITDDYVARTSTVVWVITLQSSRSWVRFRMMSLKFFIDIIFPATLWPSNRNEYHEYFMGVKAGTLGWQPYHLYAPIFLKSGSLNLLELSGSVQACTWVALHFTDDCLNIFPGCL